MAKNRPAILIALILALACATGCWSLVEVDDLAIVRSMAIDYLPGERAPFLLTMAVIRPGDIAGGEGGSGGGGGTPTRLFTGNGATLNLAIERASFSISRRIFLSHNEVILISEDAAKHGLHAIEDFILRNVQMRLTNLIVIVPGIAHKALKQPERLESGITDEILGLINQARETSETDPQEFYFMVRQLSTPGVETYAPVLRVKPHLTPGEGRHEGKQGGQQGQGAEGGGGAGGSGGGDQQEQASPKQELSLAGTAVFRNDKLAGYLDEIETRGFLWLINRVGLGVITINDPGDPSRSVNLAISRSQATIKPLVRGENVSFQVELAVEGDLISQAGETDMAKPEMIEKVNSAMAGAIKVEIEKSLRKLQELGSDIVGFGRTLYRSDPKTFRRFGDKWPEEFRRLNIQINVQANIRRTGHLSSPVQSR